MDIILDLIVKFWQFSTLFILIVIGWIINKFDLKIKNKLDFKYDQMPHMQPIIIPTKGKGFWGAVIIWMIRSRTWKLTKDFHYEINNEKFVIPAGFVFDGASIPKFLRSFLSPVGVLLIGGLIHDYGYKYATLLKVDGKTIGNKDQKWMDQTFRDINIEINGFYFLNWLAYWALRLGGFVAWNGHRKTNSKIEGAE